MRSEGSTSCAAAARQHIGSQHAAQAHPGWRTPPPPPHLYSAAAAGAPCTHRQLGRHRSAQLSSASGAHMLQQRRSASSLPQHWLRQQAPCRDRRRTMNDSPLSVSANLQELLLLWFSSSCFRALRTPVRLAYVCQCLTLHFYIVRRRASPRAKHGGDRLCEGRLGMYTQTSILHTVPYSRSGTPTHNHLRDVQPCSAALPPDLLTRSAWGAAAVWQAADRQPLLHEVGGGCREVGRIACPGCAQLRQRRPEVRLLKRARPGVGTGCG